MPKPVKKQPKKPASDPNRRAHQMLAELEAKQKLGTPPWSKTDETVTPPQGDHIKAYLSKIGKKGGTVSGAKRMEMSPKKRKEIARLGGLAKAAKKNRPERA